MLNWCENELRVEGPQKELKRFKELAGKHNRLDNDPVLNANNFIPYPKEFDELDKIAKDWMDKADKFAKENKAEGWYKLSDELTVQFEKDNGKRPSDGFNKGGYNWCCDNWGTKWGFCEAIVADYSVDKEDGEIFYEFDSAWSPPVPVIVKMAEMFPTLTFDLRYFEQGAAFNGVLRCEKGEVTEDKVQNLHGVEVGDYYGNRGSKNF